MSKKPDDAARVAGLTSILKAGNTKKDPDPSPAPPPPAAVVESSTAEAAPRAKKKRIGKYRDPNFQVTGVYLMKATVKRARRRWEDQHPDKDFSDLVQILLENWLASSQKPSQLDD